MSFFFSSVSFTLRRLTGVTFKLRNFKFVIKRDRIFFGRHPVKLSPSKNKKFPASKGYYTFVNKGWTYYILFSRKGVKVSAVHGKKVVRTFVKTPRRKIVPLIRRPKGGMYM